MGIQRHDVIFWSLARQGGADSRPESRTPDAVQGAFPLAFSGRIWNTMDFTTWALLVCDVTFGLKLKI